MNQYHDLAFNPEQKCEVQKKVKPEMVQVSDLNVQAPILHHEDDEFSFTFVSGLL